MDLFCLGPTSELLRCRACIEFTSMDSIRESELDSVGMSFRNKVKIVMYGRKIQSSIYKSKTERVIEVWNAFPDTKPNNVRVTECNVCYSIAFEVSDIDDIGSIVTGKVSVDKCYVVEGKRKFYPTIDVEINII